MRCVRTMPVLQSYLDSNVDEDTARRVAAHLEGCRRCGLDAEVYSAIKRVLTNDRDTIEPEEIDRLQDFASHLARSGDPTAGTDGS
jgi:anti-sigma factor RsiW